jgi:diguanylate cyclase (GGDEF)-like protein
VTADLFEAALALLDGRAAPARELAVEARRLADEAPATPDEARRVTDRLIASFSGLLAAEVAGDPDATERADAVIAEAQAAGRPAWSAAGRAVKARLLTAAGRIDAALSELVLAERELADELARPEPLDPPPGPTGPGAAANNLGVAYIELRMLDAAETHLHRAARLSREVYGPDWTVQACVDQANLVELHLVWALELEADAEPEAALDHARAGWQELSGAVALAPSCGWPQMPEYVGVLALGCRTFLEPDTIDPAAAARLQEAPEAAPAGGVLQASVMWTVLARVSRLLGDGERAEQAARRLDGTLRPTDHGTSMLAWREAMLAARPADRSTVQYAEVMRGQVRAHRQQLAATFARRTELARLERAHEEITVARERLEIALEQARAQETDLVHAARHDALTGLLNRTGLDERLARELARTQSGAAALTVAFIDVDDLKRVNDQHGHAAGDLLLRALARALSAAVRGRDTVARIGGDEFVAVLGGMDQEAEVQAWADRLFADLAPDAGAGRGLRASIGACVIAPGVVIDADRAIAEADAAMYEAKRAGKGRLRIRRLPA